MAIKSSNADPNMLQDMDSAAAEAGKDLIDNIDKEAIHAVAEWWKKWYQEAGHKRLARVLLAQLKKN